MALMVAISDQTYNSTREYTTVIHQTYITGMNDMPYHEAVKESWTLLSAEKKRKVLHYLYLENY